MGKFSTSMKLFLIALIAGILLGIILLSGTALILHKTSSTEFCVSCHTMQQPLAEYQGSVHFENPEGIRAECEDCHIPRSPVAFILTKAGALKDVWGEINGSVDTPEKFDAAKLQLAQSVWDTLKENNAETCRSCHNYSAMDVLAQSPEARKEHPVAISKNETCIDCHKGVAHILPDMSSLAETATTELSIAAAKTPDNVTTLYAIQTQPFWLNSDVSNGTEDGTLLPSTEIKVMKRQGDIIQGLLQGWVQDDITEVIYAAQGKRIISALPGETARKSEKTLTTVTDGSTGQKWRNVELRIWLPKNDLIGNEEKIWEYASGLMSNNCTGCHGAPSLNSFTANQWTGVIKGMSGRTALTKEQIRVLSQYVQKHASDMTSPEKDTESLNEEK
ncbi:cytochrome C [Salmonella enterica subsp. enterica serovar Bredeney]|nr:cytochrome C [Salmonella enterica subsp. enterica serovar Bredeney]EHS1318632.1 NapC/NirT family cytochrome c [Salmonella enterica subsp. enterica serovar Reading]MJU56277.1 cytochrome C [Salmonella enterica subsp. enterica serovar Montevideo]